jgi:DNA-binding SARP family transcriptional activator
MNRAQLLGRFRFCVGEEPLGFPTARVRELAAYLAWNLDDWVSREQLRSLFWPDSSEERAQAALRQSIYCLKRSFEDAGVADILEIRRSELRMVSEPVPLSVDALDFRDTAEAAVAGPAADLTTVTAAASIYAGPFLEDVDAEWALRERRELEGLYTEVLRMVVQRLSDAGLYEAAIPHARRWVDTEPLAEEAHRALMRLYGASGRPARALQQFEEIRLSLDSELGVKPDPETLGLCQAIGLEPERLRRRPAARKRPVHEDLAGTISDDPLYRAGLLVALGSGKAEMGETEEALEVLSRAARVYEGLGNEEGLARVDLAVASAYVGGENGPRPDLAVPHVERALAHFAKESGSPVHLRALHLAAFIAGACGDATRQVELAEEGSELARRLGNRDFETRFEVIKATRLATERRLAECAETLDRVSLSLAYVADLGDVAMFMVYYAAVALYSGNLKVSEARHRELVAMAETLPPGATRAGVEIPARMLLMTTYYFEDERAKLRKLGRLSELEPFLPDHAAHAIALLARPKDPAAACRAAAEVLKTNLPTIMPEQVGVFIQQLVESMSECGLRQEAVEWADIGIGQCREAGWPAFEALFQAYRARELARMGEVRKAAVAYRRAVTLRDPGDRWAELVLVWADALLTRARGDEEDSSHAFDDAAELARELGFRVYLPQMKMDAMAEPSGVA